MSFRRYAKYKDSGVEWLGDVPDHWVACRNKTVFAEIDDRCDDEDGELLTVSHITGVTPRSEKDVNMFLAETFVGYKRCRKGDLVINTMWAWMGALGCSPRDGIVSPSYNVYRARKSSVILPAYYDYLCRVPSHKTVMKAHSTGVWESRLRLYPDAFLSMLLVLPPITEQVAIAEFLDRETAKIDALVEEQRRLIELLKEKRQAVISHAVTKGLNPHAPTKPSGIEWLGDIPDHWELKRLKHVAISDRGIQMGPFGGMLKELESAPTEFKLYGQENTISNDFSAGHRWLSTEHFNSLREYQLHPGDVVLTRKGASIGHCRIVPQGIQPGVIDSDTIRVRLDPTRLSVNFAVLLMHEGYMELAILERQKGAVLPGLNTGTIANLQIALPPIVEQEAILSFTDKWSGVLDALNVEAQRAIDLLQERRTALISAAVTGKIDVRGLAESEAA